MLKRKSVIPIKETYFQMGKIKTLELTYNQLQKSCSLILLTNLFVLLDRALTRLTDVVYETILCLCSWQT